MGDTVRRSRRCNQQERGIQSREVGGISRKSERYSQEWEIMPAGVGATDGMGKRYSQKQWQKQSSGVNDISGRNGRYRQEQ